MKQSALLALLAAIYATSPAAHAANQVITFDDLGAGSDVRILGRYNNLHWSEVGVLDATTYPVGSGYRNSMLSGPNVAYTYANREASFYNEFAFSLISIGVTKAIQAGTTHFEGYSGTQLVYSMDVYSAPTDRQLVTFNWDNITRVVMRDGDGSLQTAFDNVTVAGVVPEPSGYALLLAGLGMLGLRRQIMRGGGKPAPAAASRQAA